MALDPTSIIELLLAPRFSIPFSAAVAIGVGVYFISDKTPASAAVAFGIGVVGLIIGAIWHVAGGSRPGAA